jgi:hypothetical protein
MRRFAGHCLAFPDNVDANTKILVKLASMLNGSLHPRTSGAAVPTCLSISRVDRERSGDHHRIEAMQALGLVWDNVDPSATDLEEMRTELTEPSQFGAKLLLEYWRDKATEGGFVVGRDVPSRALACVLRNLALYEPIDDAADFRVRLAGTAFIQRFGREITGLKLSDICASKNFELQRAIMTGVVAKAKPCVAGVKITRDARALLHFETMHLPVWAPNRKSVWVLGSLFYFDRP